MSFGADISDTEQMVFRKCWQTVNEEKYIFKNHDHYPKGSRKLFTLKQSYLFITRWVQSRNSKTAYIIQKMLHLEKVL
jgi:hypothetical protein